MDLFTTNVLTAIVQDLRVPQTGLLDRYFTGSIVEDSEEIHFDVDTTPRRIAPFVSPLVAGQVVRSRGFQTSTFKPAYVKDKRVFTPTRAIKRVMGEKMGGGQYSPEQRMMILVAQDLEDQLKMVRRRMEWMAAQALYGGSITVVGDNYPSVTVDFGRAAGHSVTLSGGTRWGQAGVKPLDNLQTWSDTMVKNTGVAITDVVMTVDAWVIFRADADVKTRLDRWRGNSTMQQDAHAREGLQFQGMVDNFAIYTYSSWYVDIATGTETAMLPANTVLGLANGFVEGVQHYGAILDHDALRAMEYFVKSFLDNDPSTRYLLMQSAPLTVPYRVNATFRATVN